MLPHPTYRHYLTIIACLAKRRYWKENATSYTTEHIDGKIYLVPIYGARSSDGGDDETVFYRGLGASKDDNDQSIEADVARTAYKNMMKTHVVTELAVPPEGTLLRDVYDFFAEREVVMADRRNEIRNHINQIRGLLGISYEG